MRIQLSTLAIAAAGLLVAFGAWTMLAGRSGEEAGAGAAAVEVKGAKSARSTGARRDRAPGGGGAAARDPARPPPLRSFVRPNNFANDAPEFTSTPMQGDPLEATPEQARATFDDMLAQLDAAIAGEVELDARDQREIYDTVTGAFEVLSAHVNRNDPDQLAFLETAHAEMLGKMREAGLRPARPGRGEAPELAPDRHRVR